MTHETELPLSAAQRGLWLDLQVRPAHPERFNIATSAEITGELDIRLFQRAIEHVIAHHSALRARFVTGDRGEPRQYVTTEVSGCFEVLDFADIDAAERWLSADLWRPFASLSQPLCRFVLCRTDGRQWIWYAKYHHLIFDGRSLTVVRGAVCTTYATLLDGGEARATIDTYAAYLDDAAMYHASPAKAIDREFWTRLHAEQASEPAFPVSTVRRSELNARSVPAVALPTHLASWIAGSAQSLSTELSTVLIAVVVSFLRHFSGQRTVALGVPVHGRDASHQDLIAFCSNILPLRLRVDPDATLRHVVQSVGEQTRAALAHRRYRYEDLKHDLGTEVSDTDLLPAVINIMRIPATLEFPIGAARARVRGRAEGPIHGLSFLFYGPRESTELSLAIDANSGWGGARQLEILRSCFVEFLERCAERTIEDTLPHDALDAASRARVATWGRGHAVQWREKSFIGLFQEAAKRTPEHIALRWCDGSLSYRVLDRMSDALAAELIASGTSRRTIGVYMQRSPEVVIALLGILKAGCVYLPLDPENPAPRLERMLTDAEVSDVLTEQTRRDQVLRLLSGRRVRVVSLMEPADTTRPAAALSVETTDAAYVIYTSGSTGSPKGAINTHGALANLVQAQAEAFRVDPTARVLQLARPGFDASISEIGMTLAAGATLVIAPTGLAEMAADLIGHLRRERITIATIPPALLGLLPRTELPELRTLIVAGDVCPLDVAQYWARGRRFINAYGPTETGVCATWGVHAPTAARMSIGRPLANTNVRVVNAEGELLPPLFSGELWIGGTALGRGYLRDEPLTAARFVRDAAGESWYRSGDLVRWLDDGTLEFIGRRDLQAKVRGFRVEPAEIEIALRTHADVTASAAVVRARNGRAVIDAYVVLRKDCAIDRVREHLRTTLPDFMVPATVSILEALPLSLSGKLDRRALPPPTLSRPATDAGELRSLTEERLATILEESLDLETVGRHDNFFDLGGDSLLAIHVIMEIRSHFDVEFPADRFFLAPDIASLAAEVDAALATHDRPAPASAFAQFFQ